MSTKFEFDNEVVESFCNENGVTIDMTFNQLDSLKSKGKTHLLVEQIESIARQICTDDACLRKFIEQKSDNFHPIAMTLYVLNDDLWRIMSRKHEHPEKMLPMTTIPWFYWEKEAEGRKNPYGVIRKEDPSRPLTIKFERDLLKISGNGGDFCGLLEGRIVDKRKGVRPLVVPGSTGPKKNVANYESQFIELSIDTKSARTTLYPSPEKELDYIYSEHPRVFYEHGAVISVDGEHVSLKIGRRRETILRGNVLIFIGKNFEELIDPDRLLLFHVWLAMLTQIPFR